MSRTYETIDPETARYLGIFGEMFGRDNGTFALAQGHEESGDPSAYSAILAEKRTEAHRKAVAKELAKRLSVRKERAKKETERKFLAGLTN